MVARLPGCLLIYTRKHTRTRPSSRPLRYGNQQAPHPAAWPSPPTTCRRTATAACPAAASSAPPCRAACRTRRCAATCPPPRWPCATWWSRPSTLTSAPSCLPCTTGGRGTPSARWWSLPPTARGTRSSPSPPWPSTRATSGRMRGAAWCCRCVLPRGRGGRFYVFLCGPGHLGRGRPNQPKRSAGR